MLAIRLPQDIEHRLSVLSARTGRTKSYYVREALLEHLEDLEDYYLAEDISRRLHDGHEKTHTLNAVEQELGLAD